MKQKNKLPFSLFNVFILSNTLMAGIIGVHCFFKYFDKLGLRILFFVLALILIMEVFAISFSIVSDMIKSSKDETEK